MQLMHVKKAIVLGVAMIVLWTSLLTFCDLIEDGRVLYSHVFST